jgi:transcriptional regulator with XRE-family HTH domain
MGRRIDDVIAGLPKARRDRIETKAVRLAREMIEHADSLSEIRKAMSKTQSEIARELGVGQVAVAQLEKRSDLLLSTLQRYVRAAGAELSLVVHTKQGAEIVLQSLGDLGGKGNVATKLRRATSGRTTRRRAALEGAK